MLVHQALLVSTAWCCSLIANAASPTVHDSDPLRLAVAGAINGMMSPCSYDLDYSNYRVGADSEAGRQLMPLVIGELDSDEASFDNLVAQLDKAALKPLAAEHGILLSTGVQSFHLEVGRERIAQWCTDQPFFPSFLRTHDLEISFFAEHPRLDFQALTPALRLFDPSFLMSPLPASSGQLDHFTGTRWTVDQLAGGRVRIHTFSEADGSELSSIDVGIAPSRLPFRCTSFATGARSRGGFSTIYGWAKDGGSVVWTGAVYVADAVDRFDISLYRRRHINFRVSDDQIKLPILAPCKIRNLLNQAKGHQYSDLDSLPNEWRSMLSVTEPLKPEVKPQEKVK